MQKKYWHVFTAVKENTHHWNEYCFPLPFALLPLIMHETNKQLVEVNCDLSHSSITLVIELRRLL